MLRVRLVAAAAILVPLGGILYADVHWNAGVPGIWLVPLGWIISLLAAAEVLDLLRTPGHRPLAWTVYTGVTLVFLAACVPMLWPLSGLPYPPNCPLGKLGWPLLALVAALTLAFAALLRQFHDNRWGMAALVSAILVVKLSDTGAYFFGKRFGRRKLAPRLSPGKTVAGGIGCLVFAVGAAFCFTQLLAPQMTGQAPRTSLMGTAAYGLILAVTGVLGDLGESLLKRDMGRKDSSSWLPGLGGVLDVLDSLFLSLPAAYFCWSAGFIRP